MGVPCGARHSLHPTTRHRPAAGTHAGAMDFAELERKEGVRLSWNAWPSSRIEATRVVLPFGAICTPVRAMDGMPVLPYSPVVCTECSGVLNPYCHVDFHQKRWQCCLCNTGNSLPRNYHGEATGARHPSSRGTRSRSVDNFDPPRAPSSSTRAVTHRPAPRADERTQRSTRTTSPRSSFPGTPPWSTRWRTRTRARRAS